MPTSDDTGTDHTGTDHTGTDHTGTDRTGTDRCNADLTVRAWWDPGLVGRGHDPRSEYAERFWLGIIGPSTLLLLRRFARGLEQHPGGFRVGLADTARALGLGAGTGRNSPVVRTLDRARTFGLARPLDNGDLAVRTLLPPLSRRHVARLPESLRRSLAAWADTPVPTGSDSRQG